MSFSAAPPSAAAAGPNARGGSPLALDHVTVELRERLQQLPAHGEAGGDERHLVRFSGVAGAGAVAGGEFSAARDVLGRWQCINTSYYSVVVIAGLTLVVYGLYAVLSRSSLEDLLSLDPSGSSKAAVLLTGAKAITIAIGGLVVLSALTCGLIGTVRKQRCCIACYLGLAFCWMAVCLGFGIAVLVLQSKIAAMIPFGEVASYGLVDADHNTGVIDAIQAALSCCGYNGAADYRRNACLGGTPVSSSCSQSFVAVNRGAVPASCCTTPTAKAAAAACNNGSAAGVPFNPSLVAQQGCKNAISNAVSQVTEAVGYIFVAAALVHLIMLVFSVCLHSAAEANYKINLVAVHAPLQRPLPVVPVPVAPAAEKAAQVEPPVKDAAGPDADVTAAQRRRRSREDSLNSLHQHRYRRMSSQGNAKVGQPFSNSRRSSFALSRGARPSFAAAPHQRGSLTGLGRDSMYRPPAREQAAERRRRFSEPR